MNSHETALEELQMLRASLQVVSFAYMKDARLVGSAIAYLAMLEDLLKERQKGEK